MTVNKIVESIDELLNYLESKKYERKDYQDSVYSNAIFYEIDQRKLLAVCEATEESEIKEIKNHFLVNEMFTHVTIWFEGRAIFYRNYGEKRYFIYSQRTKTNISKIDLLDKIDENFDILFHSKDISARFYNKFKEKRDLLVKKLKADINITTKYLVAQKIFDRIFFIYFLCYKGVICFSDGREISGQNFFKILIENGDFLENLQEAFLCFNTENKKPMSLNGYTFDIPYLNGGLFRKMEAEKKLKITLTKNEWQKIFEFLNNYHWIIESDVDDLTTEMEEEEDKILTPEILGHVYERSVVEWELMRFSEDDTEDISERKKKGIYYTPEMITDYITNNSLIPFLLRKLKVNYTSINEIINTKEKDLIRKAIEILDEIKILDPACGSGAFLIKASQILYKLKRRLYNALKIEKSPFDIKMDILIENIHGVDILEGAIEISKLRLWLWLISEYEKSSNEISPLPNIEYNLNVGNSLIGWVDEKLMEFSLKIPYNKDLEKCFNDLITLSNSSEIPTINKMKEFLKSYNIEQYIEAYNILYKIYRKTHGEKSDNLKKIIETIRKSIYSSITSSFQRILNYQLNPRYNTKNPPIKMENLSEMNIFHWRVDFAHIINMGGFDLILANPPYIDSENMVRNMPLERDLYNKLYETTKGNWDLYIPFYERSFNLVNDNGNICFITPNKWLSIRYGEALRIYLAEYLYRMCSCDEINVFKDAGNSPVITFFTKKKCKENILINAFNSDYTITDDISSPRSIIRLDNWGMLLSEHLNLLVKIHENGSENLKMVCDVENPFTVSEAYEMKPLVYEGKEEQEKDLKLIVTGTIDRFVSLWGIKKTAYIKDRYQYPFVKVTKMKNLLPRRHEQSTSKKIIITGIRYFECYLDEDGDYVAGKSTIIIRNPKKLSLEAINVYLNSKLVEFYLKEAYKTSGIEGGVNFTSKMVEKIPIIEIDKLKQFEHYYKEIIMVLTSKSESSEKKREFEEIYLKLNSEIYEYFVLSPEEINIIDNYR